jgi:hypothetical protein
MIIISRGSPGNIIAHHRFLHSSIQSKIPGVFVSRLLLLILAKEFLDGREIGYDEVWQIKSKETS